MNTSEASVPKQTDRPINRPTDGEVTRVHVGIDARQHRFVAAKATRDASGFRPAAGDEPCQHTAPTADTAATLGVPQTKNIALKTLSRTFSMGRESIEMLHSLLIDNFSNET